MYFKQDEHGIIHVYLNEVPVILNYNYSIMWREFWVELSLVSACTGHYP